MAAVRYYQRHHEALFRFIDDANVPIDNSATERSTTQPRSANSRTSPS